MTVFAQDTHYTPVGDSKYESYMNFTGQVVDKGTPVNGAEVAMFVAGECRQTQVTHNISGADLQGNPYSIDGLQDGQIRYLYASDHLSRTSQYGVTFERGTAVTYGDRRHVFISGTASIDAQGQVVHPGDVAAQTGRMLENVSALLAEAGAGLRDIVVAVVYLRDPADYACVQRCIEASCPALNAVYVHAGLPRFLIPAFPNRSEKTMKHIVLFTALLLAVLAPAKAAPQVIAVETAHTQLVLTVDEAGNLRTRHYGARIADPGLFLGMDTQAKRPNGAGPMTLPTTGGVFVGSPALHVRYADGNHNTELYYTGHKSRSKDGVTTTEISLKDPVTALQVKLVYEAYGKEDVILAHTEITNGGKKPVELLDYASSTMHFEADRYLLTHTWGGWASEMQVDREQRAGHPAEQSLLYAEPGRG